MDSGTGISPVRFCWDDKAAVLKHTGETPVPLPIQELSQLWIRRTEKPFAGGGVQEQFAKRGVKRLVEPALPAVRDGKRPMHHRVALIIFAWKTRKVERGVEIGFHDVFVAADVRRLKSKPNIKVSLVTSAATKDEFLRGK